MRHVSAYPNGTAVRTLSPDVSDLVADLTGFHPALDNAVAAIAELLYADLTADQTQSVIAALGAYEDGDFMRLVLLAVRDLGNPKTNPAVAALPAKARNEARRLTAAYAADGDLDLRRDLASEACAVIDRA
ncbi:hypothetical protein ACFVWP_46905 [Streptomyces sp. NPDC058175]|uniref:hypothetical protein n=1 Tax=Streptomyces sp. NPDC058175 TaxID=3346367 RepID=UPI0036E7F6A0